MSLFALLLARRKAGNMLGNLAEAAMNGNLSLPGWRNLVSRAAQEGDFDALFKTYVGTARQRAEDFIAGEE